MENKAHIVKRVMPGSIGEELEIAAGDRLVAIDGMEVEDVFDYQFMIQDTYIELLLEKPDGEQWLLEVDKDYDEDLGLEFESGLMDEYRHCHNKCVFCFIDQMPPGMRDTLYFKALLPAGELCDPDQHVGPRYRQNLQIPALAHQYLFPRHEPGAPLQDAEQPLRRGGPEEGGQAHGGRHPYERADRALQGTQ